MEARLKEDILIEAARFKFLTHSVVYIISYINSCFSLALIPPEVHDCRLCI